jgi:hypothetical protein
MVVLSFWDPQNRRPAADVFAEYPMDFEKLFSAAILMPLSGTSVRVASNQHLIEFKRAAGRPGDLEDAARLAGVHEGKGSRVRIKPPIQPRHSVPGTMPNGGVDGPFYRAPRNNDWTGSFKPLSLPTKAAQSMCGR